MTRGTAVSRTHVGSRSPENIYRRQETSTPAAAVPRQAFTKTVVNKPPVRVVDVDESNSPLDTPAPRPRAPKPTSYDTSDIEFKARQKAKSRSRSRSKSPGKKDPGIHILQYTDNSHKHGIWKINFYLFFLFFFFFSMFS